MIRSLLALAGLLFLGSAGAFFMFAPVLSIATVASLLMGLMLMFWLGVEVGTQPAYPRESEMENL
jgi:hypothetical protein